MSTIAPMPGSDGHRRGAVVGEVMAVWLVTLLLIRLVVVASKAGAPELILALVPVLFMYVPVQVCRLRGVDSDVYPLALPAFSDRRPYLQAAAWAGGFALVILVPWLIGYHYWQTEGLPWMMGLLKQAGVLGAKVRLPHYAYEGLFPGVLGILKLIGYHLFFVALPEEFFYRGYLQSRLDEAFGLRWTLFGARLGWGWLLTCVIFAIGHSVVQVQWWHFAIFFPSLVFGWMRARTDGVLAGAMFHAWCNVTVGLLDGAYGVAPLP
jgi:membrane protease YdiL (CAAX protease family)